MRNFGRALVMMACLASISCAGSLEANAQRVWRHGIVDLKSDAGFVTMLTRKGFDQKHGLKVELIQMKNGQIQIKGLISGELDSVETGVGEIILAGTAGADVKILGCSWPGLPHAILAKTEIADARDLKGKLVAASSPGSLPELVARALLEKSGISANEVRFASVGGDLDRYKALVAGVVDAAVVSAEYIPQAPKNVHTVVWARDLMPNYMRWCIASTGKRVGERRDDATRFIAAEIESLRYALSHREETIAASRSATKSPDSDARPEFVYSKAIQNGWVDSELKIPNDKLTWMQDQLLRTGNLKSKIELGSILDGSVRDAALRMLNR
jgi:NitT/TauT family transport system substrate-binding protein